MDTSNATPELFAAISVAQGKIENATKNAQNPHFKNNYADLAEVLNTVRPVFSGEGLSLIQSTEFDGDLVSVSTVIGHKSGGFITSRASCKPVKLDAQGIGAATTYLRRYSAAAIAGISQEDEDGNNASSRSKGSQYSFVSEKQATSIADYLESTGSDVPKFLAWLKADSVNSIRSQDYERAISALKKKADNGTAE